MAGNTNIEWSDKSWNPVRGCAQVSEGCRNCYAQTLAYRFHGKGLAYEGLARWTSQGARWTGDVMLVESDLRAPLSWRKPSRVFVNSMSDLYYERIPMDYYRRVWDVMVQADRHSFQVLTKRPEAMLERTRGVEIPQHIWLGVSVESAPHVDRIDVLRQVQAPIRFLSLEPLLTALPNLDLSGISWVIVGGESGRGARPMPAEWVRDIRDQCVEANVPFFFKQWGGVHKGDNGSVLDGRTWRQFPGSGTLTPERRSLPILSRFDHILADDDEEESSTEVVSAQCAGRGFHPCLPRGQVCV